MRTIRNGIINLLAFSIIALALCAFTAVIASAQTRDLCGRETTIGSTRILIVCPDWASMRAVTGFTGFPSYKGQQVFMRSSDPSVTGFRVELTYRNGGEEKTVTEWAKVDTKYDSGVGWVLGDVEIIRVRVVELRDVAAAVVE